MCNLDTVLARRGTAFLLKNDVMEAAVCEEKGRARWEDEAEQSAAGNPVKKIGNACRELA